MRKQLYQSFSAALREHGCYPLQVDNISTLQINLGKKCNLACKHCHVAAGPDRTEVMSRKTVEQVLQILAEPRILVLDITGGAPELHPDLVMIIEQAAKMGKKVMLRTNLTILAEEGYQQLANIYRDNKVHLVASLPCYGPENVEAQRGVGVFAPSIAMLQRLNALGYGKEADLQLDLVYNPADAFLPGGQAQLEAAYKQQLADNHGIVFNSLLTIANMPLGRFHDMLSEEGKLDCYCNLLKLNFNEQTVPALMCLNQVSVGWDGGLYDCDFHQVLDLRCGQIDAFDYDSLAKRQVVLAEHCFGCTAGAGSSCGGSLVANE